MTRIAACLVFALAVAGCGGRHGGMLPQSTGPGNPCKSSNCDIIVSVRSCVISVNEPTFYAGPGNDSIVWKMHTDSQKDYSFSKEAARPGIFIKPPDDGNFNTLSGGNHHYKLKNKRLNPGNAKSLAYEYGIWIYDDTNSKMCPVKDPVIVNEF